VKIFVFQVESEVEEVVVNFDLITLLVEECVVMVERIPLLGMASLDIKIVVLRMLNEVLFGS
jgi:hypothetical protein